MLSVWLEGCFWLMDDNMGIFVIELNRLVPMFLIFQISLLLGFHDSLAGVHLEVTSSGRMSGR